MERNSFFNLYRFGRVFSATLQLQWKQYFFVCIGLFAVIFLSLAFTLPSNTRATYPEGIYGSILALFTVILPVLSGLAFSAFSNKTDTENYLLLPGSTFEKYLTQALLYVVLLSIAAFCLFYMAANAARLFHTFMHPGIQIEPFSYHMELFGGYQMLTAERILYMVSLMSIFFCSRLMFRRLGLLKCIGLILAGVVVYSFLIDQTTTILNIGEPVYRRFTSASYPINESQTNITLFRCFCNSIAWLFFLPYGYFKLEERGQ